MHFLILLASLAVGTSSFSCLTGSPIILGPNDGPDYPATWNDSNYGPNMRCIFRILQVPGKYLQVTVNSNVSTVDSLTITDNGGLTIRYKAEDKQYWNVYNSPLEIQITLNTAQTSYGYFRFNFVYLTYNKNPYVRQKIVPGGNGAFLQSENIYNNAVVISCNSSLAIQAKGMPFTNALKYMMYSGFIFAGDSTNGTYLGSLYTAASGQYMAYHNAPFTITIVSVQPYDYGIALVKAFSDVSNYNVYLDYAQTSSISAPIPLDGKTKPAAITLFNPNENLTDFYLSSVIFTGAAIGPTPVVTWQTGDLRTNRPENVKITDYYPGNIASQLAQPIPGRLNTFIVRYDIAQLGFAFPTSPIGYFNAPAGASTYFTSKNYPFIGFQQGHAVTYITDYVAMVQVSMSNLQATAYANFTVGYMLPGVSQYIYTTVYPMDVQSLIGDQFVFNWPSSTAVGGGAALVTFQKYFNQTGTTPYIWNPNATTPSSSHHFPRAASGYGISLLFVLILLLAPV